MDTNILVAYATRTGSSEEVARSLAEALRSHGLPVDLRRAADVHSIDQFTAVAICAALYAGRLHKDVRRFLSEHRAVLAKIPVALFVLGPVHSDEKEWAGARQQLEKELKRFPWLSPVLQEIVGGKFDPARLGFPFNVLPALRKMPASDVRDWKLIQRLLNEMAVHLKSVGTTCESEGVDSRS
ncbi:MAG TPA: flavodoxin domain-containing protein [Terracidiphilus sp.]|nr:flavodoxin domain-containing protein [Terracidiphilus sp.]